VGRRNWRIVAGKIKASIMEKVTNIKMPESIEIQNIESINIWLQGAIEPMIINRGGKAFNVSIQITVSDVSDETPTPKPAGT